MRKMIRNRLSRLLFAFNPGKYKWPLVAPKKYKKGIEIIQTGEKTFALWGISEEDTKKAKELLGLLQKYAPVGKTGSLRGTYKVFPIETSPGKWILAISNRMWYFKFAYHYYRGEIKWNHTFIRDFVQQATDQIVKGMGGATAPALTKPPKPKPITPKKAPKAKPASKPEPPLPFPEVSKSHVQKEKKELKEVKKERKKAVEIKDDKHLDIVVNDEKMSFTEWKEGLSNAEKKALNTYKGEKYQDINSGLRENEITPGLFKHIDKIDKSISKKLPDDLMVYRGFQDPKLSKMLKKIKPEMLKGQTIVDKAFASTSTSYDVASGFAIEADVPMLAEIRLKKGTPVAFLEDLSQSKGFEISDDSEQEMLLRRGAKFKIMEAKYTKIKGVKTLKVIMELLN